MDLVLRKKEKLLWELEIKQFSMTELNIGVRTAGRELVLLICNQAIKIKLAQRVVKPLSVTRCAFVIPVIKTKGLIAGQHLEESKVNL